MTGKHKGILLGLALALLMAVPAWGAEGFSVSPVLPHNQTPGVEGYFDLTTEPGQTQQLIVLVRNNTAQPLRLLAETATASTSEQGLVDYQGKGRMDDSLAVSFAEIAAPETPAIEIAPYTQAQIVVRLQMPEQTFSGYLLGAINLSEEAGATAAGITNRFGYSIAVMINQGQRAIAPEFGPAPVASAMGRDGRMTQWGGLRNMQPLFVSGMDAEITIRRQGEDTPLSQLHIPFLEMAPNSIFPVPLGTEEPGRYLISYRLSHKGQSWDFTQAVTVGASLPDSKRAFGFRQAQTFFIALAAVSLLLLITAMLLAHFEKQSTPERTVK